MAAPWQQTHKYYFVLIEVVEKGKKIKKAACMQWSKLGIH